MFTESRRAHPDFVELCAQAIELLQVLLGAHAYTREGLAADALVRSSLGPRLRCGAVRRKARKGRDLSLRRLAGGGSLSVCAEGPRMIPEVLSSSSLRPEPTPRALTACYFCINIE